MQLLGVRRRGAAEAFLAEHPALAARSAILTRSHAGAAWHIVIHGHFLQRAAAARAITRLPAAVRAAEPWPRTVASLRE